MESEERGLVSISRQDQHWIVSALHEAYREDRKFALEEIENAVAGFVELLKTSVRETFRYDISHLVLGRPIAL
jgi:hypothetical protein